MKCPIVYLIILLTSSIYVLRSTLRHFTRWRSRSWLNQFLVPGDRTIRACQLEFQCQAQKSRLNPQTQPTYVLDQPSISNGPLPSRGRLPIRPRGLHIALHPALRLQQTTRFRWHQVDSRHDRHRRTQRDQGHGGNHTKYARHVLESRHGNVLRFFSRDQTH